MPSRAGISDQESRDGRRQHCAQRLLCRLPGQMPLACHRLGLMMERVCFMLRVRPDRLDEYRQAHRKVWPEMLDALRRAGWRNYSLFLGGDGLLIGYLECDNFAEAQAAMAASEVNTRWQASMAEYFARPEGKRADEGLARLGEVFHLD